MIFLLKRRYCLIIKRFCTRIIIQSYRTKVLYENSKIKNKDLFSVRRGKVPIFWEIRPYSWSKVSVLGRHLPIARGEITLILWNFLRGLKLNILSCSLSRSCALLFGTTRKKYCQDPQNCQSQYYLQIGRASCRERV